MEVKIKEYERIYQKQGHLFSELDAKDILEALSYAGRAGDNENDRITIFDDDNRVYPLLSMEYEQNQDTLEEFVILYRSNNSSYSIPLMNYSNTEFNEREVNSRLNQIKKGIGQTPMYIDFSYIREIEREESQMPMFREEEINSYIIPEQTPPLQNIASDLTLEETDSSDVMSRVMQNYQNNENENNQKNVLIYNHKRTKLNNITTPVDIATIAKILEGKGYSVKIKQGGHLLVQDQNLSSQNSITLTKKNAIIEDANLQAAPAIALYNTLKETVLNTVNENFTKEKEKKEAIDSSMNIAGIPVIQMVKVLVKEAENQMNEDSLLNLKSKSFRFTDEKGNEFLSLSLGFEKNEEQVKPIISISYGKKYGGFQKTLEITKDEIDAISKDSFHKTELMKKIESFVNITGKNRELEYVTLKADYLKSVMSKELQKSLSFLNAAKIDYFAEVAKEYYKDNKNCSLADYQIERFKDAPFYRRGLSDETVIAALRGTFDYVDKKMESPNLEAVKDKKIDPKNFSYQEYQADKLIYDSNKKEPIRYDREWITKLAMIQDSITELRYGPVQETLAMAASITKGLHEFGTGLVHYKSDGIYSGFDVFTGVNSLKEGWQYGAILSDMEREYKKYDIKESDMALISAIDKKMEIKALRESICTNANVYVQAAIEMKIASDNILDRIKETKENTVLMSEPSILKLKQEIAKCSEMFVNQYSKLVDASNKLINDSKLFMKATMMKGLDVLDYTETRAKAVQLQIKENFNYIATNAKVLLEKKAFTNERIAEQLNDIKVIHAFGTMNCIEFQTAGKIRLWDEINATIKAGEEAERISKDKRTPECNDIIRQGLQMKYQKEQNLYVAENLRKEINDCHKGDFNYTKAIEHLAKVYNNESMAYRLRNSESSIKNYNELSEAEKTMCNAIIKDLIHTMPEVEKSFMDRENHKSLEKETISK